MKQDVQLIHTQVSAMLERIAPSFVDGVKLSFAARLPGNDEADILITDDDLGELIKLVQRRALSSFQPIALSIQEMVECTRNPVVLRALADHHDCKSVEAGAIGDFEKCVEFHDARAHYLRTKANLTEKDYAEPGRRERHRRIGVKIDAADAIACVEGMQELVSAARQLLVSGLERTHGDYLTDLEKALRVVEGGAV